MGLNQDELLKAFVDEALEHLSTIEADFLEIEKMGADIDPERINKVFRAAHSIKGGAGFIGLPKIRDLAHAVETVLGKFRTKTLVPNREIVSVLLSATDLLRRMVIDVTDHEKIDVSASIAALNDLLKLQDVFDAQNEATASPSHLSVAEHRSSSPKAEPSSDRTIATDQQPSDGHSLYRIVFHPKTDTIFKERHPEEVFEEIAGYGTLLERRPPHPLPLSDESDPEQTIPDAVEVFLSCVLQQEDLALLLEIEPERIEFLTAEGNHLVETQEATRPSASSGTSAPPDKTLLTQLSAHASGSPEIDSPLQAPSTSKGRMQAPSSEPSPTLPKPEPSSPAAAHRSESGTQSIRVQIGVLDSLVNLAGELVLSRNQLVKTLVQTDCPQLQTLAKRLDLITSDLQHVILKTRMRPIGDLFHRFPRLVRAIAIDLGKDVVLVLEGAEVELDRTVIEAINDPLVHMLRNAVDHGIEPPNVRKALGKSPQGRIVLSAFSQGGQVILDIEDDGKGMDPERIARSAVQKGFLSEEQVRLMSRGEKMRLIFSPGLSTSDTVTQWSGRGVGLDVVKANVEQFGGSIDIDTSPNAGTRFRIKLPLTLAIVASQLVCVENHRFAVPQVHVEELIRIPAHQVKHRVEVIGNAEVLRLRGNLLPLIRLADILGIERTYIDPISNQRRPDRRRAIADRRSKRIPSVANAELDETTDNECPMEEAGSPSGYPRDMPVPRRCADRRYRVASTLHILVIAAGGTRYGLIVDTFQDFEEIVVKPLGKHFRNARLFSGATILGDGSIALILDVNQIPLVGRLQQIETSSGEGHRRQMSFFEKQGGSIEPSNDPLHLIVFRNASGESLAVPIHSVKRILRCRTREIRKVAGQPAITLEGTDLRLISFDDDTERFADRPDEPWILVVFRAFDRHLGLLGKGPIDTIMTHQPIDGVSFRKSGIIGTIRISETTLLLLDLLDLVQSRYPEWASDFDRAISSPAASAVEKHILLVEDSDFFRSHVSTLLQQAGYRVWTAVDGQEGYEILQEKGDGVALIVTDIEMPRINGFELIRLIRSDARFKHLPIVALTTLADDSDRQQAKEAGVSDYQIKLDKESLLKSIADLIHSE